MTKGTWFLAAVPAVAALLLAGGCSSGGGGGGIPCSDAGTCDNGLVCGPQGVCVPPGSGGSGGSGGGVGGSGGGVGGSGGGVGGSGGGVGGSGGGSSCTDVTDCGNTSTMVCDPATATCMPGPCNDSVSCPSGKTCVLQAEGASVGACYPLCVPNSTPCAGGASCLPGLDGTDGFCWASGSAGEGQGCNSTALNTGCGFGMVCATDSGSNVCRKICNFWSASPGCLGGQHCAVAHICFAEPGDSAAIGGTCSSAAITGEPCGSDGSAFRGVCLGASQVCAKVCRAGISSDCPTGTCSLAPGATVGVCQ